MDGATVDFFSELLTLDPEKRLTADEALDSMWFHTDPPAYQLAEWVTPKL